MALRRPPKKRHHFVGEMLRMCPPNNNVVNGPIQEKLSETMI